MFLKSDCRAFFLSPAVISLRGAGLESLPLFLYAIIESMANIYPPDFTSPIGQLRALISQTEQYKDPLNPDAAADYLMSDKQLQSYIAINHDKLYAAAADALTAIAVNENLISKKIRTEDLQTDGPAVANSLLAAAKVFRDRQADEDFEEDVLDAFEIVDYQDYSGTYWSLR